MNQLQYTGVAREPSSSCKVTYLGDMKAALIAAYGTRLQCCDRPDLKQTLHSSRDDNAIALLEHHYPLHQLHDCFVWLYRRVLARRIDFI
jgi:hypothetical protein